MNIRKKLGILILLVLPWPGHLLAFSPTAAPAGTMAAPIPAASPTYRIAKDYTTLSFIATKWMVFKEQGIFHEFSGTIAYDSRHPETASIEVNVEAASLDTQNQTRDNVLRSDDFFDVARFPTLTFHSTSVRAISAEQLEVTGDLTIHGVTKRIMVPVKVIGVRYIPQIGDMAGFETDFTIDRRDFSVLGTRWSSGKLAIDYNVEIHLLIGGVRR